MRNARHLRRLFAGLVFAVVGASGAGAAELYLGLGTGFSSGTGDGTGSLDLVAVAGSGEDSDASPFYGGVFGVAVPLSDVIPWSMQVPSFDVPYWPGRAVHFSGSDDFRFPGWRTQFEIEVMAGRDYDLEIPTNSPIAPFFAEVGSTTFMANARLDVPLHAPLNALFGRMPMLEPLTLYLGGGVGAGWNEVSAKGPANLGSETTWDFAYQIQSGFGYAVTDTTHLSLGYRYLDLGNLETELSGGPNQGTFDVDVTAHEAVLAVVFHFYHVPFFGRE